MDKLKKLLQKISTRDRQRLEKIIDQLLAGKLENFKIKKVKSKNCFRIRSGRFRILFRVSKNKVMILDIKLRDEGTYK